LIPATLDGTRGGWPAHVGRPHGGANRQYLRGKAANPGAADLHQQRAEGTCQSVAVFPRAGAYLSAWLRRMDSHRQAAWDSRAAHSRVVWAPLGRQEAGFEV